MIASRGALVPPITEEQKLADALMGVIRVRVEEGVPSRIAELGQPQRRHVRAALTAAGVPFAHDAGGLSLNVKRGFLYSYRVATDLTEFVWTQGADDVKSGKVKLPGPGPGLIRAANPLGSLES